jgi:proline iminopeptidase
LSARACLHAALALGLVGLGSACGEGEVFFVRSAGADMPVWVRGNVASGALVLVVHGGPGGSALYLEEDPAMRRLEQDFGVAYWDQRAAGSSQGDAAPRTLTLAQAVEDLGGVVGALHLRHPSARIVLLGHSWGGAVTGAYLGAPGASPAVAGWIDVDGQATAADERLSRAWAMAQATDRVSAGTDPSHWSQALDWYAANPTLTPGNIFQHEVYVSDLGGSEAVPSNDRGLGSLWLNLFTPFSGLSDLTNEAYNIQVLGQEGPANVLGTDLTAVLPGVSVPTLVVWGREDGILPLTAGELDFSLIGRPGLQKSMAVLDGAAHLSFQDQPEAFTRAVLPFVHSLAP